MVPTGYKNHDGSDVLAVLDPVKCNTVSNPAHTVADSQPIEQQPIIVQLAMPPQSQQSVAAEPTVEEEGGWFSWWFVLICLVPLVLLIVVYYSMTWVRRMQDRNDENFYDRRGGS